MKTLFRSLMLEFSRILCKPEVIIVPVLVVLILWLGIWDDYQVNSADVVYFYGLSQFGMLSKLSLILAASLASTSFCEDWCTGYFWFCNIRCNVKNYIYSKCIATVLSGGLIIALSNALFILTIWFRRPLFDFLIDGPRLAVPALSSLVSNTMYTQYFLLSLLSVFCINSLFSLLALLVSIYIPNRFVTILSPLIIWYLITFASSKIGLPPFLSISTMLQGYCDMSSPYIWAFSILGISIVLGFIITILVHKNILLRIEK